MEIKSIKLELKDLDMGHRTAIIAHAVYDNLDLIRDVSRKGMFNKSWAENKDDIGFYLDHNPEKLPGKVTGVFEDEQKAYTNVWLGTHTLGEDTLRMMDEGILKKASFGYYVVKDNRLPNKIRELIEVKHIETTITSRIAVNKAAGVIKVVKSLGCADEVTIELKDLQSHLDKMEKFCRNTTASDDCIKSILDEIKEVKSLISNYDTESTQPVLITEPQSSRNESELIDGLKHINQLFKM